MLVAFGCVFGACVGMYVANGGRVWLAAILGLLYLRVVLADYANYPAATPPTSKEERTP